MHFLQLIISAIYFFLWKVLKCILRVLTWKCEIERICLSPSTLPIRASQIEKCINSSSKLKSVSTKIQREFDVDQVLETIVLTKKLDSTKPFIHQELRESLRKMLAVRILFQELASLHQQIYDSSNKSHEELLHQLWEFLRPNIRRNGGRFTLEWQEIGFQGKDPATDFRAMGILGLQNLHYFAKHQGQLARTALHNSTLKFAYPFAITGINITAMMIKLVTRGDFNNYFYTNGTSLQQFQELYCTIFVKFDEYYAEAKPADIMSFGPIF